MNDKTLLDVCELIVDCEHKTAPIQAAGYPSIRTPNIGKGRLLLDGVNRVSEETFAAWTQRAEPQEGDLILAREAPIGNVAIVPKGLKVCLGQRTVLIRPNRELVVPYYLTYLLLGDEIQGRIKSMSNGATVHHLNMKDIRELCLPQLPEIPTQRKIAAILSAYDDLIENNTRRITILEEMAQSLYREWFVEFRFPGHEKVKMVDSPLGKIPAGWAVKTIGELLEHQIGGGWGEGEPSEQSPVKAYVIRGTDIPEARHLGISGCPLRYHKQTNFNPRQLQEHDIVFEVSGGSKGQPVGRALMVSWRLLKAIGGETICASFCKLIRVDKRLLLPELLYLQFLQFYTDGTIERYEVQSTGIKNFKFTVFLASESMSIPSKQVQEQFRDVIVPLYDQINALGAKNANLRTTRDYLLPKLISGEIDVEDMDIAVDESSDAEPSAAKPGKRSSN